MRSKKEILEEDSKQSNYLESLSLLLEVMLDIRDMLRNIEEKWG